MIEITNPSRLVPDTKDIAQIKKLRREIAKSVNELLDTVVDSEQNTTARDELGDVAKGAVNHVMEWLRTRKVDNEKIEAETFLILEQARDLYERCQSELADARLDREQKLLEFFERKIGIVEKLLKMCEKLEPSALIGLMDGNMNQPAGLPAAEKNRKEE